ncbi:SLC13 family permease [Endozoicomonas sp. G2_2]|uniref:SLC13 family permease n=1 Tax=Gammaproteobacteria TaxID=1236 RepID=UPI000C646AE6|nr:MULTISPECIES: SLC13 family permease [Gammaproteobacteria]MAS09557.1 SLC13 family permease [Salinisphaera sp.]MBO9470803.1 SLC13 family permease [Endozoicomonas sp. G2_2]
MTLDALLTLAVLVGVFAVLTMTRIAVDAVLVGGLIVLLLSGVVNAEAAFAGFSNRGLVTIAALYIVVAGLRDTGATQMLATRVLRRPRSVAHAQAQLVLPTALLSAFLNNTPVVAALIPAVSDWCRKHGLSVSQLMMPLSFAAILGGTCTLIGTSTNLLVNSLLVQQGIDDGLGMFELAWVGLPVALLGIALMIGASRWLLPDRTPALGRMDNPREYSVEMMVAAGGPLEGQTIEGAGLRQLPGMYLAEIERDGHILPAVSPREPLQGEDRLVFVGIVDSVVDLQKTRGLVPATEQIFKLDTPRRARVLIEAVVSHSCPLVGTTIRAGGFRGQYNAVVLAVARDGARIQRKIGDIVLQPGDTLLLEARPSFVTQQRHSRDFFLVSQIEDSQPPQHHRAYAAITIVVGLVASVTVGLTDILHAALGAAALMLLARCCTLGSARKTLDWPLLVAIGAAIGIGAAVEQTGLAAALAGGFIGLAGSSTYAALTALFVTTVLISSMVTNNAAAVIMFPLAVSLAQGASQSPMPYAIVVLIAASASFLTPIGYQTNLMVYGPGGYRFTDFLRLGAPLTLLVGVITLTLVPWVWPV